MNPNVRIRNYFIVVFDESQKYISGKKMFYASHEAFPFGKSFIDMPPEINTYGLNPQ